MLLNADCNQITAACSTSTPPAINPTITFLYYSIRGFAWVYARFMKYTASRETPSRKTHSQWYSYILYSVQCTQWYSYTVHSGTPHTVNSGTRTVHSGTRIVLSGNRAVHSAWYS